MIKRIIALVVLAFPIAFLLFSATAKGQDGETWIGADEIAYCEAAGQEFSISPELLEAVIEAESSGKQYAKNGECSGLMQVNKRLHADRAKALGVSDIWDKQGNIRVGASLLLDLFEKYEDPGLVLMKYNGFSKAERYAAQGKYTKYAKKILNRAEQLEYIHGKRDYEKQ